MPLPIGEAFARYRIVRLLGSGGMGEVYLVRNPRLSRHDAVKVLPADFPTRLGTALGNTLLQPKHQQRGTPAMVTTRVEAAQYLKDAVLLSGEVGVYVGQDRIAVLGPGEVIGESVLRPGKLRSATITTTGAAEVRRIERDDLASLLDEIPALRETLDVTAARHTAGCPRPADEAETETL